MDDDEVGTAGQPPARQDARSNRASILRAVGASLIGTSDSVPVLHQEAIRRTGLGRATVYRHFRDRRELAEATIAGIFRWMRHGVEVAGATGSFKELLRTVLQIQARMRPVASLIKSMPVAVQRRYLLEMIRHLAPAFERARERGEIRPDMAPADLEIILLMLDRVATAEPLADSRRPDVHRFIDLVIDGLFVGTPSARGPGRTGFPAPDPTPGACPVDDDGPGQPQD